MSAFKTMRDYNTINEEDLKHVGHIKDLLYMSLMRVFKNVLLMKK